MNLHFIMCEDKICIQLKIQSYVLNYNYTDLLHPIMDRTETIFLKYLCWYRIRKSVWEKVINCDNCQRTKIQI